VSTSRARQRPTHDISAPGWRAVRAAASKIEWMRPTQLKQAIYCHVSPSDESPKTQLLLLEVSLLLNGSGRWTRRKVSLTQAKAQTSTPPLPMHEWLQHTRRIRNLCGQRQRTLCGGGLRVETASSLASGCLRGGTRPHANVASDNSPSMAAIDAGCLSDERGIIMIDDGQPAEDDTNTTAVAPDRRTGERWARRKGPTWEGKYCRKARSLPHGNAA